MLIQDSLLNTAPSVKLIENNNFADLYPLFDRKNKESAIIIGDSFKALKKIPNNFFQMCITSPPYWSLRDYSISGQIGLESSLDEYISSLVRICEEIRRTLKDSGVFWFNIGDSYTSGGRTRRAADKKNPAREMGIRPPTPKGLCQVPVSLDGMSLSFFRRFHFEN